VREDEAAAAAVKNSQTRFRVNPTPLIKMAFSFSVASATGLTEVGRGAKHKENVHFPAATQPFIPEALIGQSKDSPRPRTARGHTVYPWLR
jgi:hypothetical protein